MCPNKEEDSTTCPGIPGTPHPDETRCNFVNEFFDTARNRSIAIINNGVYFSAASSGQGFHRITVKALPLRDTFDAAQEDLNRYAMKKGWYPV
jgi:hypothetical protein